MTLFTNGNLIMCKHIFVAMLSVSLFAGPLLHAQPAVTLSKEARKEAKALMKAGWQVSGQSTMEEQIERGLQFQSMLMEGEHGEPVARYWLTTAEATDASAEIATTKARSFCEALMVQALQSTITSLTEHEITTRQTSQLEAETCEQTLIRSESLSKACLQQCRIVRQFRRKNADGTTSVQMMLSLDKRKIINNQ